jgi:hypothetical protein|uniref:Uncharacterized protein n=1 Tax=viral metagenome TaxID=1070528 RepID=A0A6C0DP27_9ZZZZ
MNTSTIPSGKHIDYEIPIVSTGGGDVETYKDPNSPETLMKKLKELHVQNMTDMKYDVNVSPYVPENFENYRRDNDTILLLMVLLPLAALLPVNTEKKESLQYILVLFFAGSLVLLLRHTH